MSFLPFLTAKPRYDLVLLDADDTLYDFGLAESRAFRRTLTLAGYSGDFKGAFDRYKAINKKLWADLEKGLVTNSLVKTERFRVLFGDLSLGFSADQAGEAFLRFLGEGSQLLPGALGVCRRLARRSSLVIVTNGMAGVQRSRVERSALKGCIRGLVVSEEVGAAKPDPAIFARALEVVGHREKRTVLMVGDSLSSDIRGGLDFGIDTCWYNPGGLPVPDEPRPTYEVRRLGDLVRIVVRGLAS